MLNVCKLLYRLSKEEGNDGKFIESDILSMVLEILKEPWEGFPNSEILLYATASLKHISTSPSNMRRMINEGAVKLFGDWISPSSLERSKSLWGEKATGNIAVQVPKNLSTYCR